MAGTSAASGQATIEWRRLAADRNVSIDVARGLWERAKATASDPVARSELFRRLLDDAANNPAATPEPGRETLVDAKPGGNDPASLGPGKFTRVLLEQDQAPGAAASPADPQASPAPPNAAGAPAPGADATNGEPPTAKPTVDKLRSDLVAAAQASQDAAGLIAAADPATILEALRQIRAGEQTILQKVITVLGAAIERRLGDVLPDPEQKPDGPPGIKVSIVGGDGEVHTHTISDAGVPMMDTTPIADKVAEWRADILKREPVDQQEVIPNLARATSLEATTGDQAKQAKLGDEPAKTALPDTQRQLGATLGIVSRALHAAEQKASAPATPTDAPAQSEDPAAATAQPGAPSAAAEPTTASQPEAATPGAAPADAPAATASAADSSPAAATADSTQAAPSADSASAAPSADSASAAPSADSASSAPSADTAPAAQAAATPAAPDATAPTSSAAPAAAAPTQAPASTLETSTSDPAAATAETPDAAAATAPPVPTHYEAYATHIRGKFAGDIGELARMAQESAANGGDLRRATQRFELTLEQVSKLKAEFEATKAELTEKQRRSMQAQIAAQEAALPNAGLTMPELLEKAKELCARIEAAGEAARSEKSQLEGVMNASIMLGMQIDPMAGEAGRDLYVRIDTQENPALVAQARAAGMPEAEVAAMAVNHRNWLRQFVRTEIMQDQNHAEILFLRDLGLVGARTGLTVDQVMAKVIAKLQKPDPQTKQAALSPDFKIETATPAELDQIYAGVIGSAATTNAGVNASSGAGASGQAPSTAEPVQGAQTAINMSAAVPPLGASAPAAHAEPSAATDSSAAPGTPSPAVAEPNAAAGSFAAPEAPSAAMAAPSAESAAPNTAPAAAAESAPSSVEAAPPNTASAAPTAESAPSSGETTASSGESAAASAVSASPATASSAASSSPSSEPVAANTASAAPSAESEPSSAEPAEPNTAPAPEGATPISATLESSASTGAPTSANVAPAPAPAAPTSPAAETSPTGPGAANEASVASTHSPEQSKAEIASVTSTPIAQGKGEEPATLLTSPPSIRIKTDSPDPIRLKDEIITLTKEYLELDRRVPAPDAAERQAKLNAIKLKFEALRVAMAKARGEEDKLVQLRVKFEKFLGVKATHEWTQGTQCVTTMSQQARSMLVESETKTTVSAANLDHEIESLSTDAKNVIGRQLGTPINIGFAGAVGNTFRAVIDALTSGSLVQKCQTLINFAEKIMTGELMKGAGPVFERAKANLAAIKATDPNFDLDARLEAAKDKDPKAQYKILCSSPQFLAKMDHIKKVQNKDVDKEREAEGGPLQNKSKKSSDNTHLGGDMDTKLPQQPVENLTEPQLDFLSQQGKPSVDLTPFNSEPDAERRRQKKVNALKSAGIHLSQAPGVMSASGKLEGQGAVDATSIDEDAVTATVDRLTVDNRFYIEGKAENIVDPKAKWIMDANAAKAPLKAGISGTTARFVGAANLLGGTKHGAAVAMIGHLQAIEAHSFWEIVDAAGLAMQPGKYTPFPPHPTGMTSAATEFVQTQASDIALGPGDAADKQKVLLGETKTK